MEKAHNQVAVAGRRRRPSASAEGRGREPIKASSAPSFELLCSLLINFLPLCFFARHHWIIYPIPLQAACCVELLFSVLYFILFYFLVFDMVCFKVEESHRRRRALE
jgi:hypothetical protein